MLKRDALSLSILVLFVLSGGTPFATQASSNSCLDCHLSIEKLKDITSELEKKRPKKSIETAGEG